MKFFSFLTNSRGKINPRAALGLLGGVAAAGLTIGGYQHDVQNYPPERLTFAGLEDVMQDGTVYHGSSMNYSDNLGVVASAGDKEGGAKYVNVDNLGSGIGLGSAYQAGGGDNLVGNGRVTDTGKITYGQGEDVPDRGDYSTRPSYNYDGGSGADAYGNGGGATGSQLAGASMARASGGSSGSSNSYTPGGSRAGAGGNGGNSGVGGTPSAGEGYRMTGNMPGSSVDMAMAGTHSRADFNNGSRDLLAGRSKTRKYGEGLAGLAKHSADIASNVHNENANAQGRVFLNGERAGVGGINFASPGEGTGMSDDLAPATIAKAQKGIKNWEDSKKAYVKRLAQKRKKLAIELLELIGATLIAAIAMNYLIQLGKKVGGLKGIFLIAAGWLCMLGVSVFSVIIMKHAGEFMHEFKTDAGVIGTIGIVLPVAAMAFLTYIGIRALTAGGTAGADMKNILNKVIGEGKGMVKGMIGSGITNAAQKVVSAATDKTADK